MAEIKKDTKRPKKTATGQPVDQIDTDPSIKKVLPNNTLPEAVITFGKFNPPHAGHVRLVEHIRSLAKEKDATPLVFVSKGKGLLDFETKLELCKEAFGSYDDPIIAETDLTSVFDILKQLTEEDFSKVTLVVGSDRYAEFKERVGLYFETVEVVEFKREGHESSTYLREAVAKADFEGFKSALPTSLAEKAEEVFETISFAQRQALKPKAWSPLTSPTSKPNVGKHAKIQAMEIARRAVRSFMANSQGRYYDNLTPVEKLKIDKMMARKAPVIQKVAQRLLPKVTRPEFRALQMMTGMSTQFALEDVGVMFAEVLTEKDFASLDKKAEESGLENDILDEVFVRGLVYGGSTQTAFQRVNSFIAGNVLEEDADILDEISKGTLNNYIKKATGELGNKGYNRNHDSNNSPRARKYDNHARGFQTAIAKANKYKTVKIHATEEAQLNELSTKTLRSYYHKAFDSAGAKYKKAKEYDKKDATPEDHENFRKHYFDAHKRWDNAEKARKKIAARSQTKSSHSPGSSYHSFKRAQNASLNGGPGSSRFYEETLHEESPTKGTRLVSRHGNGSRTAEVRYSPEWKEYSVHHYKDGKHMGEGPVSYHGNDKQDAKDTAEYTLKHRKEDLDLQEFRVGDKVRATNPKATPRYTVIGKNATHYQLQRPDGRSLKLPKARIHKVNLEKKRLSEADVLDELSDRSTLSYFDRAALDRGQAEKKGDTKRVAKRDRGLSKAFDRITKDSPKRK